MVLLNNSEFVTFNNLQGQEKETIVHLHCYDK